MNIYSRKDPIIIACLQLAVDNKHDLPLDHRDVLVAPAGPIGYAMNQLPVLQTTQLDNTDPSFGSIYSDHCSNQRDAYGYSVPVGPLLYAAQ